MDDWPIDYPWLVARESQIQHSIINRLKREQGLWLMNVHGDEMQRAGIPDIIGCYFGRLFGLEIKAPGGVVSEIQKYELRKIANAGGKAAVVESVQDALDVLGIA